MNKYIVIKNGIETNSWTEDYAGADYYEPGFGLPERIVEDDGQYDEADVLERIPEVIEGDETIEPAKVRLRAEYSIEVVDISAELQEKAIMQAVAARRAFGDNLINKMSARNAVKPGWDVAKTLAYIAQTESVMKLLQAGAIETALSAIGSVEASAELEQADIDFAIAQIQAFLGQ